VLDALIGSLIGSLIVSFAVCLAASLANSLRNPGGAQRWPSSSSQLGAGLVALLAGGRGRGAVAVLIRRRGAGLDRGAELERDAVGLALGFRAGAGL
jgi:hypothetical protein